MKKWTQETFIKKCQELYGDKYDYSDTIFTGIKNNIDIICKKHGKFQQLADNHLRGHGCRKCSIEERAIKHTKSYKEFILRAKNVHNELYEYDESTYKNMTTKIRIICKIHGEFWQTPHKHLQGDGCPFCSSKMKSNTEEFINKAKLVHQCDLDDYSKINYINALKKVEIICKKHGSYFMTPANYLQGQRCPLCCSSKLEEKINNFLNEKLKIPFIRQKKFKWLGKLSLDFYIPSLNVAIECQGIQHFQKVNFFGGEEKYLIRQEYDILKKQLCEENGVRLLYFSDLGIDYPYQVYEDKEELLKEILKNDTSN